MTSGARREWKEGPFSSERAREVEEIKLLTQELMVMNGVKQVKPFYGKGSSSICGCSGDTHSVASIL